jgi:hypothetical protein
VWRSDAAITVWIRVSGTSHGRISVIDLFQPQTICGVSVSKIVKLANLHHMSALRLNRALVGHAISCAHLRWRSGMPALVVQRI